MTDPVSNAEKIAAWRMSNPTTRLTEGILLDALGLETLSRADLSGANLYRANLSGADLSGANLSEADLYRADLSGATLYRANLSGADLSGADLSEAALYRADLSDTGLLGMYGMPSGWLDLRPVRGEWLVSIGCWRERSLDGLRALIADDVEWPEAKGAEREARRPYLVAALALCEAHIAHPNPEALRASTENGANRG